MKLPLLKVCGLANPHNIREVVKLQPHYIGFVFYHSSLRNASHSLTHEFAMSLPASIKKVGVFVDDSMDRITNYIAMYNLDYVQLHGKEDSAYCAELKKCCGVIKAFGVDRQFDFRSTAQYEQACDFFLFDTKTPQHGGSGARFDHSLLEQYGGKTEFFLGGGLSEKNIAEAHQKKMKKLHALDVNSRIEIAPGVKDIEKIRQIQQILATNES